MKRLLILIMLCAMAVFATACGGEQAEKQESAPIPQESQAEQEEAEEADPPQAADAGKSIVVYFSRVGNTDFPEDVDAVASASLQKDGGTVKGNAQLIAEWIADEAGCETFEIVGKDAYPADYNDTVDQASEEQSKSLRPELKTALEKVGDYDAIYLVYPNWWGDLPMPVYTFLDNYDLSGKKINVFATHEGSGFSDTVNTIKELEPKAEVTEGLDVRGGSVTGEEKNIREWVKENR